MTTTVAPPSREEVLASIRDIGHWRVRIVPESAVERFRLPSHCGDAVARSAVLLRGNSYPYVSSSGRANEWTAPVEGGWEAFVHQDWRREVWRLMRAGQFIHYRALDEDIAYRSPPPVERRSPWFISGREGWHDLVQPQEGRASDERVLLVEPSVWTLYEIVEFARRLTASADYGAGIELEIDLADAHKRRLVADWALPPRTSVTASVDCVKLRRNVGLAQLASEMRDIARDLAVELFDLFEFTASPRAIAGIQDKLLERR